MVDDGSVWLRRSLCQAAQAAWHSKNTYLSAQVRRLAVRKGVGHTILVILFHRLNGADYFDRHNSEQLNRSLLRRLERLGLQVSILGPTPVSQPT